MVVAACNVYYIAFIKPLYYIMEILTSYLPFLSGLGSEMKGRLPLLIALGAAAGGTGVAISNRTPVIKSGYIAPSAILPAEAFSKESLTYVSPLFCTT